MAQETLAKQDQGLLTVHGEKITVRDYLTKWLDIARPTAPSVGLSATVTYVFFGVIRGCV